MERQNRLLFYLMGIFATFLALGFVVFFHELGHFAAARWAKIHVYEFAVGFGPKVYSFIRKTSTFSLRLLPLGGFVKLAGIDDQDGKESEIPEHQKYPNKTVYQRMVVIVAGSAMNVILGFLIYLIISFFVGIATVTPVIEKIMDQTAAQQAGLKVNDRIISINGTKIVSVEKDILPVIQNSSDQVLAFEVERQGKRLFFEFKALADSQGVPKIGVQFQSRLEKYKPIDSFLNSLKKTLMSIQQVFKTFAMLFSQKVGLKDLAGPVGIFQIASYQYSQSVFAFLNLMAYISVSLGIINLFPFPVLDGGHLFFLIWEAIFKKPVSKKLEAVLSYTGVVVLVSLMLFVLLNDVLNWQARANLIQRIFSGG